MKFSSPAFFWLMLLAIPLILLYFLKLRRKPLYVSSTLLWEKTLEDLRVNAPFQRLKRSLLLFLQLLILLFVTTALARPVNETDFSVKKRVVFILDSSASMKTLERDVNKTRFEIAKKKIEGAVAGLKEDELVALITFASRSRLVQSFTSEKQKFLDSLEPLKAVDTGSYLEEALNLADALMKQGADAEIILLSDGNFVPQKISNDFKKLNIRYVSIGQERDNVGIINFAARINPQSRTRYDLAITLANTGVEAVDGLIEFRLNNTLVDAKQFSIQANKEVFFTITDERLTSGTVKAKILRKDPFMLDNQATIILPEPKMVKILLISDGNPYLEKFLAIAGSDEIKLEVSMPKNGVDEGLKIYESSGGNFDLVIFDMCYPEKLSGGNYVFLGAVPPLKDWSLVTKKLIRSPEPNPPIEHPLTRYVDFRNVFINRAPIMNIPTSAKIIIDSENTPLVSLYTQKELKILVFGFDIYDSNWPLQHSFVVFFKNIISFMTSSSELSAGLIHLTGESFSIFATENKDAVLISPGKKRTEVQPGNDGYWHLGEIEEVGVYSLVVDNDQIINFTSALMNADESRIEPRPELFFEGEKQAVRQEELKNTTEYWKHFLIIAMILLIFEWFVYHRRPFG